MSVKLIDNEAFYGFRVRRTVNGKLYQEYFSLKKGGKRLGSRPTRAVELLAQARDAELQIEQEKSRRRRKAELCFHPDGSVKGISYLVKTEKSGTRTPIFQIGIASELEERIVCTSFSINAHGADAAWNRAIETYAQHKKISKGSKLYKKLAASMPGVGATAKAKKPARAGQGGAGLRSRPAAKKTQKSVLAKAAVKKKLPAKSRPVRKKSVKKTS
jgi:hypothetical protein